jgi:DNA-binding SARP family transcriptional activator
MADLPGLTPPSLRIRLLGRFEVWRAGQPIPAAEWRGQKTRDLLKILLLAQGHYLAKDQLSEWLWPGADPQAAGNNLRSAVSDLRRLLEPDLARGRDSTYIQTRHEGYCFSRPPGVVVDTVAFERAAQADGRVALEAALSAYPGDLLEEDPYAEWASAERARLRGLRLDALARVAELCLAEGEWSRAVTAAEQGLALDPSRETLWRAVMRAHALHGDRAAALAAFDRCRATLARDLGTDPLPDTLALHQQLLQDEWPAPAGEAVTPMRGVARPPAWLGRLAAAGIGVWVAITAAALAVSLAGLFQGNLVSPGDPGADALPRLLASPAARQALDQQLYFFLPVGLLLLPAYLAWFGSLRAAAQVVNRSLGALAWIGLGLGGLDLLTQTLSRAITVAQLAVLPSAYVAAALDQRPVLAALWDVLQQVASLFGTLSAAAEPLAVTCLCLASLLALRAGQAPPLRGARLLAWVGISLAGFGLLYTFVTPPIPADWWLPIGVGLAGATYAWWLGLAVALWPRRPHFPKLSPTPL